MASNDITQGWHFQNGGASEMRRRALSRVKMAVLPDRARGFQDTPMIEERLEKIETKCAYQEDLIEELNKTIYLQQQKLAQLEATCESLARHIAALYESASNENKPANERPPHY